MILYKNTDYFNNDFPTVISFFTKNWEYSNYARKLKNNCEKLKINYYIEELKSTGDWLKNTQLKTEFILNALRVNKRPVLWIDVDGSLLKLPFLVKLPIKYDFMAKKKPASHSRTWHVGTMFFNYNNKVLNFVEDWTKFCLAHKSSDEWALELIWKNTFKKYKIISKGLPKQYFHMLKNINETNFRDDVIVHRASKDPTKLKRQSKKKN